MGVYTSKQKIESKMLLLKLRREQIKIERNNVISEIYKRTGKVIQRKPIPEYIENSKSPKKEKHLNIIRINEEKDLSYSKDSKGKTSKKNRHRQTSLNEKYKSDDKLLNVKKNK